MNINLIHFNQNKNIKNHLYILKLAYNNLKKIKFLNLIINLFVKKLYFFLSLNIKKIIKNPLFLNQIYIIKKITSILSYKKS